MSFSINTNTSAMTTNLNSNKSNNALDKSLGFLSSGSKLGSAANDASGLTIADQLSAQVSGLGQMIMNANDGIGMIQIADGAMSGINDNMSKIRELTLKASSPIMNSANREAIQNEINGLMESSNQIAQSTSYNGINLLNGGDGSLADVGSINNASIDVTTEDGLSSALETIDGALGDINKILTDLGASQNKLVSEIRNTSVSQINAASAESQIRDVDFAAESANFSQQNLMSQIGSFAQAQANATASNVTRLFS